jgi:Fe-S cluster biogenesis protein NfuA
MKEKVEKVLEKIRPFLQADGGDVQLVEVNDATKTVKVALKGACGHCPSAMMTLKMVIEKKLKEEIPEIEKVEPA